MKELLQKVDKIDKSYGVVIRWLWNLLFYPGIALGLWAGSAYLDKNYVSKAYFDSSLAKLVAEKKEYAEEQKAGLKEINGKLDLLLQNNAASAQRFTDAERRLSRLEDKADSIK